MPRESTEFRLAQELWSETGLGLEPAEFQSRFNAIYESAYNSPAIDLTALWQLCGAANDYLRLNTQAKLDCRDLPLVLLRADFVDARIIGLKLLNRTCTDLVLVANWIFKSLESTNAEEICGGLYELGVHLEHLSSFGRMNEIDVPTLIVKLEAFQNSIDECIRDNAKCRLVQISEL